MNGTTIRNSTRVAFSIVPEAFLQDSNLSFPARVLGAWLAGRPANWEVHRGHVQRVLGLKNATWEKSLQELKKNGYLATAPVRSGGRWAGQQYHFDAQRLFAEGREERDSASPGTTFAGTSGTGAGDTGARAGGVHTRNTYTNNTKTTTTTTPRERGAADVGKDVVVVTEEDQARLIWPEDLLTKDQLTSMRRELLGNAWPGLSKSQALLDELAGQLQQPGKVKSAPGLLRQLLKSQQAGTFTDDYGTEVRNIREARQKHHAREAAALAGNGQVQSTRHAAPRESGTSGTSEAARRERQVLAALRESIGRAPAKSLRQTREARK